MLYVNIGVSLIYYFLNSYYSGKLLGYSSWMQLKDVLPSYGVATIVAISVWFLKYLPISYWIILPVQLIVGATVFFVVCNVLKINEYQEVKQMLMPFIKKIKK